MQKTRRNGERCLALATPEVKNRKRKKKKKIVLQQTNVPQWFLIAFASFLHLSCMSTEWKSMSKTGCGQTSKYWTWFVLRKCTNMVLEQHLRIFMDAILNAQRLRHKKKTLSIKWFQLWSCNFSAYRDWKELKRWSSAAGLAVSRGAGLSSSPLKKQKTYKSINSGLVLLCPLLNKAFCFNLCGFYSLAVVVSQ